ncbi:SCO3374 family protein [Streptomyces sp. NPDC052077]|uniref:SCO3374 family protein n=1 Tax=Streptomyces sp. NPDC052077 TaxID=3154757 RepID=UPI00343BBDB0
MTVAVDMIGVPPHAAAPALPLPRRPAAMEGPWEGAWWWYENVLGWPVLPGTPLRLRTGVRFDVLEVPAGAGRAALRRLGAGVSAGAGDGEGGETGPGFPVAVRGGRMLLLVAAGGAEELPGLLEWLEWGPVTLDLTASGAGGCVEAPLPPSPAGSPVGRGGSQGAAVWLRPPVPGREAECPLPALSAVAGPSRAPDLARLVHTLATQVHRTRLSRAAR